MNYTIRIKRQENPQASPCWQEFSFEGSADTSIASVLNELNHRSPLCEKSGILFAADAAHFLFFFLFHHFKSF